MAVLFISDLHLDAKRPRAIKSFVEFIAAEAIRAEQLFILGDLFEVWIGDDDDDPAMEPAIAAIESLRYADVPCYIMHGNRDFLIGEKFAERTGCQILTDYVTIDVFGKQMLLTHGDLLCTDDRPYMRFREKVRNDQWKRDFLGKPLSDRREIARSMREMSQRETSDKPEEIMDVNQTAVEQTMRSHGVRYLIHGHTHRPGVHRFELDNELATRIVLGDWFDHGMMLRWDIEGFKLATLAD